MRKAIRDRLRETKLLKTIVAHIQFTLDLQSRGRTQPAEIDFDADPALPGNLWDPTGENVVGGRNFFDEPATGEEDGSGDP